MHIRLVKSDKKRFLDLLLLADEQESMIDRYIERGDLFVMEEKGEAKSRSRSHPRGTRSL